MKNKDKTLNLEASQAIASLWIECESEKWWCERDGRSWLITFNEFEDFKNSISFISTVGVCFAPSLQELLALLPAIAITKGITEGMGVCDNCGAMNIKDCCKHPEASACKYEEYYGHRLLDTFTANYDMEDVSAEIIRIIKE